MTLFKHIARAADLASFVVVVVVVFFACVKLKRLNTYSFTTYFQFNFLCDRKPFDSVLTPAQDLLALIRRQATIFMTAVVDIILMSALVPR